MRASGSGGLREEGPRRSGEVGDAPERVGDARVPDVRDRDERGAGESRPDEREQRQDQRHLQIEGARRSEEALMWIEARAERTEEQRETVRGQHVGVEERRTGGAFLLRGYGRACTADPDDRRVRQIRLEAVLRA